MNTSTRDALKAKLGVAHNDVKTGPRPVRGASVIKAEDDTDTPDFSALAEPVEKRLKPAPKVGELEVAQEAEPAYDRERLNTILDDLVHRGFALYEFDVRGLKVVLRTRFDWEERHVFRALDDSGINMAVTYQSELNRRLLAASILRYGNAEFAPMAGGTEEERAKSLSDRLTFLGAMSGLMYSILEKKLVEFDNMQRYILTNVDDVLKSF